PVVRKREADGKREGVSAEPGVQPVQVSLDRFRRGLVAAGAPEEVELVLDAKSLPELAIGEECLLRRRRDLAWVVDRRSQQAGPRREQPDQLVHVDGEVLLAP